MASLSNIVLTITAGPNTNTAKVTVTGKMTFTTSEISQNIRMSIRLYGQDKAGDALPSNDPIGDDLLATFMWHAGPLQEPYKEFTAPAAGTQAFSETRLVAYTVLDEDKGKVKIGMGDIHTPLYMPRKDEIYAWVGFLGTTVSARSPIVIQTPFGV